MPRQTVHLIAAARPNFMKVAPLWHALQASGDFAPVLVHTGQHYDANMSDAFLDGPRPARSRFPSRRRLGQPCRADRPGDDRLWQGRRGAPARLAGRRRRRQFDRRLRAGRRPSSASGPCISRRACARATGACRRRSTGSSPTRSATCCGRPRPTPTRNLLAEGVPAGRITRVGNIMLDSFEMMPAGHRGGRACRKRSAWPAGAYGVVDAAPPVQCRRGRAAAPPRRLPGRGAGAAAVVFPVHPAHRRAARRVRPRRRRWPRPASG